jgi:dihydroorotate dehydrogenase electron transfer subunit
MPQPYLCAILEHREVAPHHFRMKLAAPELAASVEPGQFVHVLPRAANSTDPLLRRAFSVMTAAGGAIEILYRIMGRGTALLSRLRVGDKVDVLGPLGRPFTLSKGDMLLVGGGVGVPPLVMLAAPKAASTDDSVRAAIIGARTAMEVLCLEDFAAYGVPVEVSTDDGNVGHHGRVTDLLEPRLWEARERGALPTVYSCGPIPMLHAVAALCAKYGASCQASLEENMPCGIGVCNGCVIPVTGAGDDYGRYRRICIEGPALWTDQIDWSHLGAPLPCEEVP